MAAGRGGDDGSRAEHAGPHRQLLTRWDVSLKLVPGLATSWKNVNETTWEFALRPGAKFHDGSPLTAEDVKATIERAT